jgi:hypothetical protein
MALVATYTRNPIVGADSNAYNSFVFAQISRGAIGANSIDVSNVGGALTVGLGYAGIDDGTGTGRGTIQVTTAGTVSLAGSTAGAWHALECSLPGGTVVTFSLTALAGETDESFMSLTMKGYYDATKCGYYRIASRRTLAFVFIRAGTVLGRIVNCESGVKGFKGIVARSYYDSSLVETTKYYAQMEVAIPIWNMDSTASVNVALPFKISTTPKILGVYINSGSPLSVGNVVFNINQGAYEIYYNESGAIGRIVLSRLGMTYFDNATYNAATGLIEILWET